MNAVMKSVPAIQAKDEGSDFGAAAGFSATRSASLAERGPLMRLLSRQNRSPASPSRLALAMFEPRNQRSQLPYMACRRQGQADSWCHPD